MAKTIIGKTAATMVALAAITAPTAVMAADNTTASPQSAVVENGIYFKGEVNKYYTIPELAGLTPQEKSDLLQKAGGLSNIVVVIDNQYSTLQEVSKTGKGNGGFYDVKKPLTKEDNFFEEGKNFTNSKGEPVPNPFDETPEEKVNETFFYNLAA